MRFFVYTPSIYRFNQKFPEASVLLLEKTIPPLHKARALVIWVKSFGSSNSSLQVLEQKMTKSFQFFFSSCVLGFDVKAASLPLQKDKIVS
jgi:hypothetical protein